jgi:glucan biosynthesis protein C
MMASETASPPVSQTPPASPPRGGGRLLFVDNIRVFLTVLVILHHLMVIYAGSGGWIHKEGGEDAITQAAGEWFCSANQAYFMGLFLLISAYFVPGSYDRKGPVRFTVDRLVRLGIPLAVYSWIVRPLYIYFFLHHREGLDFSAWYRLVYLRTYGLLGGGPLWFVEALLFFSLAYVAVRLVTARHPPRPAPQAGFPGNRWLALFALLLGAVTFLVRLAFPVNEVFTPLNFQFANFPQYIALFVAGLVAYRRNWLLALPDRQGRLWLGIAVLLILLNGPVAVLVGAAESAEPFPAGELLGSLVSCLWEAFVCVGMCTGLTWLFRRRWNCQGRLARELSRDAYTAYLIHEPVITTMAVLAMGAAVYPLLKFALAAAVAVPLCFALSAGVRRLPTFDRVL